MPRSRRPPEGPAIDLVAEEVAAMIARLGDPFEGMTSTERKAAERQDAKWQRRIDKAKARWHAMTVLERSAWTKDYQREQWERYKVTAAPKAADLPLLYAIVVVCDKDNAKKAKAYEARQAAAAAERAAAVSDRPTPSPTSPSPAPEAPAADAEPSRPEKPRRRRQGPAFGPVGQQIDGVFYPYISDDDDD